MVIFGQTLAEVSGAWLGVCTSYVCVCVGMDKWVSGIASCMLSAPPTLLLPLPLQSKDYAQQVAVERGIDYVNG